MFRLIYLYLGLFLSGVGAQSSPIWDGHPFPIVRHGQGFTPDAVLNVTSKMMSQSCLPERLTIVANGTSPGPALRLQEGRTTWIRVYNSMIDHNLTMHWHGLSMAVSPFSDGTPLASQWPIPPQHFFDYEINVPIGMAGTYFYHSHVGFQAVTCTGPLIVEDLIKPYPYDEEKILFLSDVFNKTDSVIEEGLVSRPLQWSGESAMVLFNGKGGGTANGTFCNASLSVINVKPDRTYRLRFIGGTALTYASIAIEGHDSLTVIEVDGAITRRFNTSHLQVGTGQRYSVLLRTHANPSSDSFFIQAESRERPTVTRGYTVLRYQRSSEVVQNKLYPPLTQPFRLPNTTLGFLDYQLRPRVEDRDFPKASEVTRRVTMKVKQRIIPGGGPTIWVQNRYPWTEDFPKEPYLISLYKNDGAGFPSMARALENDGIDPVTRTFPAEIGEVLEIVIQNTAGDSGGLDIHPFHAHGAHFYDLGSGNGTYDAAENELKWKLAGAQPVKRDTTMLYRYRNSAKNGTEEGWRAWRIRVTQPGVWMVHCHILQHMVMGMQTVWVMGNATEVLGQVPVDDVEGYLTYGGSVYGNTTHWPTVVHFQDVWAENQRRI